ncbi:MAG TPA: 2-oxoacid:ferredoxin oxidoreductase subunit beta [Armatimonadota bacterium]|nr:2-oxoacid:ferredoxin oxidoreductase subunit beta [Armatimonadota bacterium]
MSPTLTEARPVSSPVENKRTVVDYRSENKPTWCPGCGDFGVLAALYKALQTKNLDPKDVVIVSGIGCSGRLPEFAATYGFHGVHGRALPIAMGVKQANPKLTVIAVGGDGDGFAIGGGHVPHAVRRNVDITYIVMDNQVYGLTKGQPSPTTPQGETALKVSSSMRKMAPYGDIIDRPLNMLALVLTYGASFVARGFSGQPGLLTDLYLKALDHKGFSFVQALSPCPTFFNTYDQWKELVETLPKDWDASDRLKALQLAFTEEAPHTGLWHEDDRPSMDEMFGAVVEKARGEVTPTLETFFKQYM